MRTTNHSILYYFIIAVFLLVDTGCQYEEGPFIPFRTRENRLINSWQFNSVLDNGANVTTNGATYDYSSSFIGFNDANRFTAIYYMNNDSLTFRGNWGFINDFEEVELDFDGISPYGTTNSDTLEVWAIKRLKNKSFWARQDIGEQIDLEYRLVPSN